MSQFVNQILPSYVAGAGFVKMKPSAKVSQLSQGNNPFQSTLAEDQFISQKSTAPMDNKAPLASRLLGKHLFV